MCFCIIDIISMFSSEFMVFIMVFCTRKMRSIRLVLIDCVFSVEISCVLFSCQFFIIGMVDFVILIGVGNY